jgi:hypothetical protein
MFLVIKSELDFRTRARRVEKCSEGFSVLTMFSPSLARWVSNRGCEQVQEDNMTCSNFVLENQGLLEALQEGRIRLMNRRARLHRNHAMICMFLETLSKTYSSLKRPASRRESSSPVFEGGKIL